MRVDDVVAQLELDELDLAGDLQILQVLFGYLRNDVLLGLSAPACGPDPWF
jgi:hypothetical protein